MALALYGKQPQRCVHVSDGCETKPSPLRQMKVQDELDFQIIFSGP